MRPLKRTMSRLVWLVAVGACAAGAPVQLSPRPEMDPRDVLEFRYQGRTVTLESVRFSADSLSGIPWRAPTDPRVAFFIADVTRAKIFRTGNSGDTAGRVILITMGAALLVLLEVWANALSNLRT